jgi:hypothetical protein
MALYLIERNFAEQVGDATADGVKLVNAINDDVGVRWLLSFLSADKKKSYCVYEAADPELIRESARRAGVPADVIIEVGEINPAAILAAAAS